MHIFEYPYVIITILVLCFLIMGVIALYFWIKCMKTASSAEEKGFSGIGRLENNFEKLTNLRRTRCVTYIAVSLSEAGRMCSGPKISRIFSCIKSALPENFCTEGSIAAYGSDNFVAVNTFDAVSCEKCAQKCLDTINSELRKIGAANAVEINFGFCVTDSTQVDFITSVNRAKQACTMAQNKNIPMCRWDNNNGREFEKKIKIESNIHNEIDNNRFFLEYQPIVDARTHRIVGAEVLSRLNSNEDGIMTPGSFLSAIDKVGLSERFDYYIFEKNCKWISNDKNLRAKYVYTINFSRSTLCDEEFAAKVKEIAEKYQVPYSCLAIEILEDKEISEKEKHSMNDNLSALKKAGFHILLDDFGRGYTSFSDLGKFDVSVVKIDKAIIKNAVTQSGLVILKGILNTAKQLGYKTLCEGVETSEEMKIATEAGCDFMQGFYFYRPLPVTKLETLLENNDLEVM